MERETIEAAIRAAFAGVRLGAGVSLRQADAIDHYLEGWSQAQFERLPESEVTHDWTLVPEEELRRDNIAHLDADGLRYYLPALMLWMLDHYDDENRPLADGVDMTVIGTMGALAPSKEFRAHHYLIYDTFSAQQRAAIALYLDALPRLVELDGEDTTLVERALRDYWGRFLPPSA